MLARHPRPVLAIVDRQLPDGDGVDVLRAALAVGTPVIIVTGYGSGATRRLTLEEGAAGFLAKPFSGHDLLELVRGSSAMPPAQRPRREYNAGSRHSTFGHALLRAFMKSYSRHPLAGAGTERSHSSVPSGTWCPRFESSRSLHSWPRPPARALDVRAGSHRGGVMKRIVIAAVLLAVAGTCRGPVAEQLRRRARPGRVQEQRLLRLSHDREGRNADRARSLAGWQQVPTGLPGALAARPGLQRPSAHMPALELTEDDVKALAAYLGSLR